MRDAVFRSKCRVFRGEALAGLLAFVACLAAAPCALAEAPPLAEIAPPAPSPPPDPQPAVASSAPSSSPPTGQVVAIVFGGAAVAGVAAGTVFGVLALHDKNDFQSHPTLSAADSANENAVLADVCFGAAVALGVTSIVLLLKGNGAHETALGFTVSPVITRHGGGAGAALLF